MQVIDKMVKFKFDKKGFLRRLLGNSKVFFLVIFIALGVAILLTGKFFICLIIALLFSIIVLISLYKWNVFFIEELVINEKNIFLKVYKYNQIFLVGNLEFNEVEFEVTVASSSIRGVSNKLVVNTKNKIFNQYEMNGWKNNDFEEIKDFLTLHHPISILSNLNKNIGVSSGSD